MNEGLLLSVQALMAAFPAVWLLTGVWENWRYPLVNETFTAEVLEMRRLREGYPDVYTAVAYRAVSNRRAQTGLFRFIVIWETIACILALLGAGALLGAAIGWTPPETATALAVIGLAAFTATWAGFLIAGNWFCYWFGHEGAQNTHFQMTLWGLATMIFVSL